jgi:hypothetical protein
VIKLDPSTTSVVVTCTDCPYWYAFAWTRDDAELRAIAHEELVHPESHNMRDRAASRVTTRRARASVSAM